MLTVLDRYIVLRFIGYFLLVLLVLWSIDYLFEVIDLLRRTSRKDVADLLTILEMGLFKMPLVGQRILPFAVLISALLMFWQMARQHEWIVMRSLGWPAWRFLAPVVIVALCLGMGRTGALQPLGAVLYGKYERWDRVTLRYKNTSLNLLKTGLWLREPLAGGGNRIVNVARLASGDEPWEQVSIWEYDATGQLLQRFDAPNGNLIEGKAWLLPKALRSTPDGNGIPLINLRVPTTLTVDQLAERFASPETMNFWRIPNLLQILRQNGLATAHLEFMQASLWAEPVLYAGLILLAGAFAMRYSRSGREKWLVGAGLVVGFVLFFMRDMLEALAVNQILPITLAAWIPGLLALLSGTTLLSFYEDG